MPFIYGGTNSTAQLALAQFDIGDITSAMPMKESSRALRLTAQQLLQLDLAVTVVICFLSFVLLMICGIMRRMHSAPCVSAYILSRTASELDTEAQQHTLCSEKTPLLRHPSSGQEAALSQEDHRASGSEPDVSGGCRCSQVIDKALKAFILFLAFQDFFTCIWLIQQR